MSNTGSHISQLWNEILKHHWLYLETEESLKKLEQRKQLEGYLQQLLSVVRHDRKFYLPETEMVLRDTICNLTEFNIQKAILAFEAISQYANNLFTKPWRKEFHTLKMYSGFFQHEIKSNLLGTEKLLEAMGYRQTSEQVMILDGPICPDQVTNVSRDAMTAYMELKIIKHIHDGLDGLNSNVTWLDIYHYRENHVGDATQAIKFLTYLIQRQQYIASGGNKTNILPTDNYDYIDVQSNGHVQADVTPLHPCQCRSMRNTYVIPDNGYTCAVMHEQQDQQRQTLSRTAGNIVAYNNLNCKRGSNNHRSMHVSHTRSLEHYVEPNARVAGIMPQTHSYSFEQSPQEVYASTALYAPHHLQHYQQLPHHYDSLFGYTDSANSLDGSSNISYATVAKIGNNLTMNTLPNNHQQYNVSGNRYPLPYNLSCQFPKHNDQWLSPIITPTSIATVESSYTQVPNSNNHIYATVSKPSHPTYRNKVGDNHTNAQRHCASQIPLDQFNINVDGKFAKPDSCIACAMRVNTYNHREQLSGELTRESCLLGRENRKLPITANTQKFFNDEMGRNGNARDPALCHHRDLVDGNGDALLANENHHHDSLVQLSHKNHDGVGSFESWDYVFQHLKQNGNNNRSMDTLEDVHTGGDTDLLLNTLHIRDPADHQHSENVDKCHYGSSGSSTGAKKKNTSTKQTALNNRKQLQQQQQQEQEQQKQQNNQKQSITKQLQNNNNYNNNNSNDNNNNNNSKDNDNKSNNNDYERGNTAKQPKEQKNDRQQRRIITNIATAEVTTPATTSHEWNCRFCTFLNPPNKRICDMCYHTKDFDLQSD